MKTYEPHRNLITGIENKAGTNLISQFSYLNDAIGRRTQRVDSLSTPSTMSTNLFGYNVRSELANAVMADNTYNYDYDQIGNREKVVRAQTSEVSTNEYLSNDLNQYTNITCSVGSVSQSPVYDSDGNLRSSASICGKTGWKNGVRPRK